MKLGEGFIEVRPDTRAFKGDLQREVQGDVASIGRNLQQALIGGAFLAGAKKATDAASQLEQAVGGTAAVFGESARAIDEWSKEAAESAGLSERAARELTSQIGGLLKGFQFTEEQAADLSIQLAQLGADLAATFGGRPEDAVIALGAALRGETDPLERFGIALNQTLVNQRAVDLGLAAATSSVDQHAKAQATLSLIMERSADAQGQFAREADSAAGQAAISAAKVENSTADLGESLLPIYSRIAETVGTVADVFGSLPEPVQTALIALGGIAALSGPTRIVVETLSGMLSIVRRAPEAFDRAATGAYDLAGGLGRVGRAAVGLGTQLGLIYGAVHLLDREANRADLSKLSNDLLDLAEGGDLAGEAATVLGEDFRTLQNAIEDIAKPSNVAQFGNAIHNIGRLGQSDAPGLEQSRQVIEDLDAALSDLAAQDPDAAAAALAAINEGLSPEDGDRLVGMLEEYDSTLTDIDTSSRTAAESTADFTTAVGEQTDALNDLLEATLAQFDANIGYKRSLDDTEEALAKVLWLTNAGQTGTEDYRDAALDAEEALLDQAAAAVRLYEDTALANGETLNGEQRTAIYKQELVKLAETLAPGSDLRKRLEEYIYTLGAIPSEIRTSIKLDIPTRNPDERRGVTATGFAAGGDVMDGLFQVHDGELMRKHGSSVEVIAGAPERLTVGGDSPEVAMLLRLVLGELQQISGNTAGPTSGQRLRRTQAMAGVI